MKIEEMEGPFMQNHYPAPTTTAFEESSKRKTKSGKEREKETRKRTRVTPDQLVHLEKFFSEDCSPTAIQRKDISDILGMDERQTQIWFQNRRAKSKAKGDQVQGRGRGRGRPSNASSAAALIEKPSVTTLPVVSETLPLPQSTPMPPLPVPVVPLPSELAKMVPEDEDVTFIPCKDLTIGSWRRISTSPNENDLFAYICDKKRCLNWFIHSAGYGFKMEIPFDDIVETQFTDNPATMASSLASFIICQPPRFYIENISHSQPEGPLTRSWSRCADWTERQQASSVLRHDLVGSSEQLGHLLANLQSSISRILHVPSSASQLAYPSPEIPKVQIPPPPPMVPVEEQPYSPQNDEYMPDHRLRRMASDSSTSSSIFPSLSYSPQSYGSPMSPDLSEMSNSYDEPVEDYGTIIESLPPPPPKTFAAQAVTPSFYQDKNVTDQEMYILREPGTFIRYNNNSLSPLLTATAYQSGSDYFGLVHQNNLQSTPTGMMSVDGYDPNYI